jgi:hypothetical protein
MDKTQKFAYWRSQGNKPLTVELRWMDGRGRIILTDCTVVEFTHEYLRFQTSSGSHKSEPCESIKLAWDERGSTLKVIIEGAWPDDYREEMPDPPARS